MDIGFLSNTLFRLAACPHEAYEEFRRRLQELVGRGDLTYLVMIGGLIPQSSIDRRRWTSGCASGTATMGAATR